MLELVDLLREKQGTESDAAFAQRLGINRETWRSIRVGKFPPGPRTLRRVMAVFPDLQGMAMLFFWSRVQPSEPNQ